MKNLFLVAAIFFSLGSVCQDLSLSDVETHVAGISGTDGAVEISSKINVTNNTDASIEVSVKREILLQDAPSSIERFCWGGLCYAPGTEVSPLTLIIEPGVTIDASSDVNGFTGYYNYNEEDGVCQIKYTFFETGNETNLAEVVVHFCVDAEASCQTFLGTEEISLNNFETSVYPNPASENFNIAYQLATENSMNKLVIYNLLGEVIKEIPLNERAGVANFDASEFEIGMYFYLISNGNQTSGIKKFIIN